MPKLEKRPPFDLEKALEDNERKALEEDNELKATAREFMGNALLKILDNQTNENK